jgi:cyclase
MDVKKKSSGGKYEIWTYNATLNTKIDPVLFAQEMEERGAGEIVINSIDLDGTLKGYDLNIIQQIHESINIPLTVLGGAGSLKDIGAIIKRHGVIGTAAGSLFVFKGKYQAVLINYPDKTEKEELIKNYFLNGM